MGGVTWCANDNRGQPLLLYRCAPLCVVCCSFREDFIPLIRLPPAAMCVSDVCVGGGKEYASLANQMVSHLWWPQAKCTDPEVFHLIPPYPQRWCSL